MRGGRKLPVATMVLCLLCGSIAAQEQLAATPGCPPQSGSSMVAAASSPPSAVNPGATTTPVSEAHPRGLSTREKFGVYLHSTYSPYTLITSAFDAGMAQANGDWYRYGGGINGYSKRYGAALANNESGVFFGRFLYPTLLKQDPRYLSDRRGGAWHRIAFAASRVLVTKNDNGGNGFNSSHVLATFTASGLSNSYYPRNERGFGDTMVRASSNLLDDAITNVLREFWPDIRKKLVPHEPKRIKRLEDSPRVARIQQIMSPPPVPGACPLAQSSPSATPSKSEVRDSSEPPR